MTYNSPIITPDGPGIFKGWLSHDGQPLALVAMQPSKPAPQAEQVWGGRPGSRWTLAAYRAEQVTA